MFRYSNTILILILFLTTTTFAQNKGTIKGTITDAQTKNTLIGANIQIDVNGKKTGVSTDKFGRFILTAKEGSYALTISFVGYEKIVQQITVRNNTTLEQNFSLKQTDSNSQEVIVERGMLIGNASKITGIPGSAHYLTKKELEKQNYNDIHRMLQEIPGINIQEEDGYGLRPNIGMRGSGAERNTKITVMEDGVLIAPAPYSAPAAYYFPTVGRMEAIEVRKGSSQVKYGPYTTGGALNLVSTSIPVQFQGNVKFIGGEDDERTFHVNIGDSQKNFAYLIETYQSKVDGFKELDAPGETGFDKKDYLVKFRFNTSADSRVYQSLGFKFSQTDEISNETYLGLTDADFALNPYRRYSGSQEDVINTDHDQYQLNYLIRPNNVFDINTTVYRNEFARNWYKLDRVRAGVDGGRARIADILDDPGSYADEYAIITGSSSTNDNALEVKANNRSYVSQGVQSILGYEIKASNEMLHQFEVGMRYHWDEIDRFQWVDLYRMDNNRMELTQSGIPGTESNRVGTASAWAYFVQYKFKMNNFTAMPGLRYENITLERDDYGKTDPSRTGSGLKARQNDVSVWIPGIGIDYKFNTHFNTFAGIHKGFTPPGSAVGTEPEESINYELGMRAKNSYFSAEAVLFLNDYSNLLGADLLASGGTGSGDLLNGGEAEVKGLELQASYDIGWAADLNNFSIPVSFTYTFTDAKFRNSFESDYEPWGTVSSGDELPYLSRHQFSISAGVEKSEWSTFVSGKYADKMRTVAGSGNHIGSQSTDSHFIVDFAAEYQVFQTNKLFLNVRNLFDKDYIAARRPAGARPGLPRIIQLGIKTSF